MGGASSYGASQPPSVYASQGAPALAPNEPPLPWRKSHRGLWIALAVIAVVLLAGGGGVAYCVAHPGARQQLTAKGTFTTLRSTTTSMRQEGPNQVSSILQQSEYYGDLTGMYTVELTLTVHADNSWNFSGSGSCTCTVFGKSGTLMWIVYGTGTGSETFQGQDSDFRGTSDLAKLSGQGEFQGQGAHGTYSFELGFDS